MKHIILIAQVAALSASWSSNRADAMAAAAMFAVLCVVAVIIGDRRSNQPFPRGRRHA